MRALTLALNPSAGRVVAATNILGGVITAGTNGASGKAIAHVGAGSSQYVNIHGVQFNGWTSNNPALDAGSQTRWVFGGNNGIPTAGNIGQWDLHVRNGADSSMQLTLDSGNAAAQNTDLIFNDRGSLITRIRKSSSNTKVRFTTGVAADGGGFKHRRVSTGSIAASSSAAVTVSWTTAFADANYTASCSVVESTAGANSLRIHHLESVSAASVVVRVVNDDGSTAKTGTLHCAAIHD